MFDVATAERKDTTAEAFGRPMGELLAIAADPSDGPGMAAWLRAHADLQARLDGRAGEIRHAFDSSIEWARDGVRSPATWLTLNTGCSTFVARTDLKTATLAHTMPHVLAAAAGGELGAEKVRWLTRARKPEVAEVFDRDEADLVELAKGLNVDRLREALQGWCLGALEQLGRNAPDGDPPLPETITDRLALLQVAFGRATIEGELSPESYALLLGALDAELRHWRRTDQLDAEDTRGSGPPDGGIGGNDENGGGPEHDEPATDAPETDISEGLDHAGPTGSRPDHMPGGPPGAPAVGTADPRGTAQSLVPTCHIAGVGPVPVSTLARLLRRGVDVCRVVLATDGTVLDSSRTRRAGTVGELVEAVARAPSAPLDHGRSRRLGSAAHYRALIARTGGSCDTPGCHAPHWRTQIHHLEGWDHGGHTDVDNLVLQCHLHHDLLHRGFTLRVSPEGLQLHRPDGTPIAVAHR